MTPEEFAAYEQLVWPVLGLTAFVFFTFGFRCGRRFPE